MVLIRKDYVVSVNSESTQCKSSQLDNRLYSEQDLFLYTHTIIQEQVKEFESFLNELDHGKFDASNQHDISTRLIGIVSQAQEAGDLVTARLAEIDRQVFLFSKSFDVEDNGAFKGISWAFSGTATLEDGTTVPHMFPDISTFVEADYDYIAKRYNETENLYAKTEYGTILYFQQPKPEFKHNDFKQELASTYFDLAKEYLSKKPSDEGATFHTLYFFKALESAFIIATSAKLSDLQNQIILYAFEVHQNWPITGKSTLRIVLDLTNLMTSSFKLFSSKIDMGSVLAKNIKAAKEQEKTYTWGAIHIIDGCIALNRKAQVLPNNDLFAEKAKLFEKLVSEAEGQRNMAAVTFAEQALRLYEEIGDENGASRLEAKYTSLRGNQGMSEIRTDFPAEYVDEMKRRIHLIIDEGNQKELVWNFVLTPMFSSLDEVRKSAEQWKVNSVMSQLFPTSIIDKFGNTIEVFSTAEEKEEESFWQAYGFSFQTGTQWLVYFFVEAIRASKLSFKSVQTFLEERWIGQKWTEKYNSVEVKIRPLDLLLPSLESFFTSSEAWIIGGQSQPNWIMETDSLITKIEALLRYMCRHLSIATFKPRKSRDGNAHNLVMEKNLDEILADLKHEAGVNETNFDEDDRIFIKYVLTGKFGQNLRNRIAHGLMDSFEYRFENVVLIFTIIMRLAKYEFTFKEA